MSVLSDQAISQGDLMRRVADLERQVKALTTARRLEAASVGHGGLRIQGGRLLAEDLDGDRVFEVTTDPANLFMRQDLFSPFALQVFADRIRGTTLQDVVTVTSGSWGDPAAGGPGPVVTDVDVGPSGLCLVIISAQFGQMAIPDGQVGEAQMSVEITGASNEAPGRVLLSLGRGQSGTGGVDVPSGSFSAAAIIQLAEGVHTLRAQYQLTLSMTSANLGFPTIAALPF